MNEETDCYEQDCLDFDNNEQLEFEFEHTDWIGPKFAW